LNLKYRQNKSSLSLTSNSTMTIGDSESTARMVPRHCSLIAQDEAGAALDAVLVLELHMFQSLVAEVVALGGATPDTHHVAALVALLDVDNNMREFVVIDIVTDEAESVLHVVGEEANLLRLGH
jgi:hypothetical protein